MIEISYDNVMNGLDKGLHMNCICENMRQVDYLLEEGHLFRINELVHNLDQHNERYLEQWRA